MARLVLLAIPALQVAVILTISLVNLCDFGRSEVTYVNQ